ncbi:hypothetical protein GFC01_03425 [Desulfofundulus thermobenzoicus]|uniref:Uncharacterized protein n=1 Tax=Desulfofundulus thermobenzoicus TaxID=29376 RepID=A0A6N7IP09_9FIRM|nr:hypothetical protein [Desulfofundulus thermobenzoicus]MQL51327.1 hypothetical protein [Desulfofundulus thermobenzoicus]
MEMETTLSPRDRQKFRHFKTIAAYVMVMLALLILWTGTDFLKEAVFKHYFNPSRHMVVDQDPVTGEIYAWKDVLGNVYTPDDPQVRMFPFGVTLLTLVVGLVGVGAYNILCQHFLMVLILQGQLTSLPSPRHNSPPMYPSY